MSESGLNKANTKFNGIYIGVVKDNMDPDKLGRLKVVVPTYNDNTALDDLQWFDYCSPYGGYKDQGFFFVPSVGANVVCMFISGSEKPIWLGTISKKQQNMGPKESTQEADEEHYFHRKQIKTRAGYIMWDDQDEYLLLKHNCGSFISLKKDGDVDVRSEKNLNFKAGKSVTISAEKGDFSLEAYYAAKLEAKNSDFTIEAVTGKLAISSLKQDIFLVAGKKIHGMADTDIKWYANEHIYNTAVKETIHNSAGKNVETYAKKQVKSQSDTETLISAKQNLALNTNKNFVKYVENDFKMTVGKTGVTKYGKSNDLVVESGDLNVTTSDGKMKFHSTDAIQMDTNNKLSIKAVDDVFMKTDADLKVTALNNITMGALNNYNVRAANNYNQYALNETREFSATKTSMESLADMKIVTSANMLLSAAGNIFELAGGIITIRGSLIFLN